MNNQPRANANGANVSTARNKRMSRMQYLLLRGPLATRILTYVAMGLALISLVLVIIIGYKAFYGSVWDLPIAQMFIPEADIERGKETLAEGVGVLYADIADIDKKLAELTPEERRELEEEAMAEKGVSLEEYVEQSKAELIEQFEESSGIPFEIAEEMLTTFSLHSIVEFIDHASKMAKADESFALIKGVYTALVVYFVLLGLLIALSAIFVKKWTLILEFVLALALYFIFGGFGMTVALFVLMIAYCIIQSNVESDWKQYKYSF